MRVTGPLALVSVDAFTSGKHRQLMAKFLYLGVHEKSSLVFHMMNTQHQRGLKAEQSLGLSDGFSLHTSKFCYLLAIIVIIVFLPC